MPQLLITAVQIQAVFMIIAMAFERKSQQGGALATGLDARPHEGDGADKFQVGELTRVGF